MKDYLNKMFGKDNKKRTENLVVFLIILIITFIAIKYILGEEKTNTNTNKNNTVLAQNNNANNNSSNEIKNDDLENKLADIINTIQGIQKVKVMVTYSESSSYTPVFNEDNSENSTEETDSSGGVRKITEKNEKKEIVYEEDGSNKVPITSKTISPKVEGVIVTAIGVSDGVVKSNVVQAVEAATGVPTHKIQVFEMNK